MKTTIKRLQTFAHYKPLFLQLVAKDIKLKYLSLIHISLSLVNTKDKLLEIKNIKMFLEVSMIRKRILILGTAMLIGLSSTIPTLAETAPSITMENSGAYLFTWRPVDYGNGQSFAILVGGNTINESDVILNRGYDYGYTFQPNKYSRPWGQVPDLVIAGGVWRCV